MRRVKETVSLELAEQRLITFRAKHGDGPHKAAWLAGEIWRRDLDEQDFITAQGAGAAASRVLKKLGCKYVSVGSGRNMDWGWSLASL